MDTVCRWKRWGPKGFFFLSTLFLFLNGISAQSLRNIQNRQLAKSELLPKLDINSLVKVRVRTSLDNISLSGFGIRVSAKPHTSDSFRPFAFQRIDITRVNLDGRYYWKVASTNAPLRWLQSDQLYITAQSLRMGAEPMDKSIILHTSKKPDNFDLISQMNIQSYLQGVLPSEMPVSWPLEALKAQAIASRSYTYAIMSERQGQAYHLESGVEDQVYKRSAEISLSAQMRQKVFQAIQETKDTVLVATNRRVLKAYYHSDCGGKTETPGQVWGSHRPWKITMDRFCPQSPGGRWQFQVAHQEVGQNLIAALGLQRDSRFKGIFVRSRSQSGRVGLMDVVFEGQPIRQISSQQFRRAIGFQRVKSTRFELEILGNSYRLRGQGHGHGVGLCQWGSQHMAKNGKSYSEILKHYYPMAMISQQSASPIN